MVVLTVILLKCSSYSDMKTRSPLPVFDAATFFRCLIQIYISGKIRTRLLPATINFLCLHQFLDKALLIPRIIEC